MLSSCKVDQEGQVLSGEVVDDPGHAHDAVFGKISDDGPNYRNVRNHQMSHLQIGIPILTGLGWMVGYSRSHDEDPTRPRHPVHSLCL